MEGGNTKTPGEGAAFPGVALRVPVEPEPVHGLIVVFSTLDELRVAGPLPLRMWLERRPRAAHRGTGQVLEFERGGHQEACLIGGSS